MTSNFTVHNAAGYEQLMGRWSRELAPAFIEFVGIGTNEKILDVGCGTGSLTLELASRTEAGEIVAIDYSPTFVEAARQRNSDPRVSVQQADATALPFADGSFDRALALLVLHFVSDAPLAIREMRRVVKSGGTVGAVVWDHFGGMTGMRMIVDTLAGLSEAGRQLRNRYVFQPMMQPGEMKQAFVDEGLDRVVQDQLMMRMTYRDFDDLWAPIAAGEGPIGKYVGSLEPTQLNQVTAAVRDVYECGKPDGPRSFANVAWACRGIVS